MTPDQLDTLLLTNNLSRPHADTPVIPDPEETPLLDQGHVNRG